MDAAGAAGMRKPMPRAVHPRYRVCIQARNGRSTHNRAGLSRHLLRRPVRFSQDRAGQDKRSAPSASRGADSYPVSSGALSSSLPTLHAAAAGSAAATGSVPGHEFHRRPAGKTKSACALGLALLAEQAQPVGRERRDSEHHEQPIRRTGELPHEKRRERRRALRDCQHAGSTRQRHRGHMDIGAGPAG